MEGDVMPDWIYHGLKLAFKQKDKVNIIKYSQLWDEYRNELKE